MASPLQYLLFFILFIFQTTVFCHGNLQESKALLLDSQFTSENQAHHSSQPPTVFFEVTKPIRVPPDSKPCTSLVLQHSFAYTYKRPPVTVQYNPPSDCPFQSFSKIVLTWSASCKGRQFDRIFGVWLGGVELLRSCTAEPRATGIVWTVEKDITKYSSLLKNPNLLSVYLGNLIDSTYTGVYHVNVTFSFYSAEESRWNLVKTRFGFGTPADLILPISRDRPLKDGLWFLIENSTDVQVKEFVVPRNVHRAVLEVFVSFHSDDEFWYGNPPNEYIKENNLNVPGNGPFREVVITLDGEVVGAVWPFTVIYTGGFIPLLWRPITGIGSFDLPTYDIEITPFLGKILDGKSHKFGFSVTNGLSVWFVDANLHLWLDHRCEKTDGGLIKYKADPFVTSLVSHFKGLNGTFITTANRSISSTGWVKSSLGIIIMDSFQGFDYKNWMVFGDGGNLQVVNQTIDANYAVYAKHRYRHRRFDVYSNQVFRRFPLYLYYESVDQGDDNYSTLANVSLGFLVDQFSNVGPFLSFSSLSNFQGGRGYDHRERRVIKSGLGSTQQVYRYDSSEGCYFRNVSASNYTVLHDESRDFCNGSIWLGHPFQAKGRRAFQLGRFI